LLGSALVARSAAAATVVKCVGEQSTMTGHYAVTLQWPALLQTQLGASYTVTNDGDNMASVLTGYTAAGAHPFMSATNAKYTDSKMGPNVVVIGPWGMHDQIAIMGNPPAMAANFQTDYDMLVSSYLALMPKPIVIVMTGFLKPTDAAAGFLTYQNDAATLALVMNTINPAVKAVATKYSLPVIDIATQLTTVMYLAGDGGLTQPAGQTKVANLVFAEINSLLGDGGTGGSSGSMAGSGMASSGIPTSGSTASGNSTGSASGSSSSSGTVVGMTGTSTGGSGTAVSMSGTTGGSGTAVSRSGTTGGSGALGGSGTAVGGSGTTGGSGVASGTTGGSGTLGAGSGVSASGTSPPSGGTPVNSSGCALGAGAGAGGGALLLSLLALAAASRRRAKA
jgi:hypothetical protein